MDIRARPVSFSDRPSIATWVTRSRTRRRDLGTIEAIPLHPPSLARLARRAPVPSMSQSPNWGSGTKIIGSGSVRHDPVDLAQAESVDWRAESPAGLRVGRLRDPRRGVAAIISLVSQSELTSSRSSADAGFVCSILREHAPCDAQRGSKFCHREQNSFSVARCPSPKSSCYAFGCSLKRLIGDSKRGDSSAIRALPRVNYRGYCLRLARDRRCRAGHYEDGNAMQSECTLSQRGRRI